MVAGKHKVWLSPFIAVLFIAVSLTGVFLLVHIKGFAIKQIHEWGGILFLLAGAMHMLMNWRSLKAYLLKPPALWGALAGAGTIALFVALFPFADHGRNLHDQAGFGGHGYSQGTGFNGGTGGNHLGGSKGFGHHQ